MLDVLLDLYGHVDLRSHLLVRWLRRFSKRARPHAEQEEAAGDRYLVAVVGAFEGTREQVKEIVRRVMMVSRVEVGAVPEKGA